MLFLLLLSKLLLITYFALNQHPDSVCFNQWILFAIQEKTTVVTQNNFPSWYGIQPYF